MHSQLAVHRFRGVVLENSFVARMLRVKAAIQNRWLSFSFARRFYRQACQAEPVSLDSETAAPVDYITDCLFRRSVPATLHLLVQLRVASQLACIDETRLRSRLCRQAGWSHEQVGAALLGSFNESLSEPEKLVLRFADDMTRTPIDVDPQLVKQLHQYFSRPDLLELTAAIAHENFRLRLADAQRKLG